MFAPNSLTGPLEGSREHKEGAAAAGLPGPLSSAPSALNFPGFHPFVNFGFRSASWSRGQPGLCHSLESHSFFLL